MVDGVRDSGSDRFSVAVPATPSPMPTTPRNADRMAAAWLGLDEQWWIAALVIGVCLLHVVTATWFPAPWTDEVMYSDPAVRWLVGKGFTSTAWPSQPSTEFWASNSPLHENLLACWLAVFGISPTALRSINVVFGGLAVWLLCMAARRGGWVTGRGWTVVLAVLLLTAMSMTKLLRYGRPDAITLLVAAAVVYEFAAGPERWRWWYVVLLGAVVPWAGLQLGAYAVGVFLVALLLAPARVWRFGLCLCGGMALGVASLLGYLAAHGVALCFLQNTVLSGHTVTGDMAQLAVFNDAKTLGRLGVRLGELGRSYQAWLRDPSFPWVIASLLGAALWAWRTRQWTWRSPLGFGLLAGLGVPLFVMISGRYPWHYTWMGYIIVAVSAAAALSQLWPRMGPVMRGVTAVPLLVSVLVGTPLAFRNALRDPLVDWDRVETFFREQVRPTDHALVLPSLYYVSTAHAAETYLPTYGGGRRLREWPADQQAAVTVMVIEPSEVESSVKKIVGEWVTVATLDIDGIASDWPPRLVVLRRAEGLVPAPGPDGP